MAATAITFDFHATLAKADRWFDLEVRDLAAAVLRWDANRRRRPVPPGMAAAADEVYRRIRTDIAAHGRELPAERCVAVVLREVGATMTDDAIAIAVEVLMRETLDDVAALPGVVDTVRELTDDGVPLGVVSSAVYHPFLEWSLDRFGIRDAFATVTTSASSGFYKSRPEIFLRAVAALGAEPRRSVHVGDSLKYDVGGARRAGMKTAWVRPPSPADQPAVDGEAADLTLADLVNARPALLRLLHREPS